MTAIEIAMPGPAGRLAVPGLASAGYHADMKPSLPRITKVILATLMLAYAFSSTAAWCSYPGKAAVDCRKFGVSPNCVVEKSGSDRAEEFAKRGDNLIRLILWDAWGNLEFFSEFVKPRDSAAYVFLSDIHGIGSYAKQPVSLSVWNEIVGMSQGTIAERSIPL